MVSDARKKMKQASLSRRRRARAKARLGDQFQPIICPELPARHQGTTPQRASAVVPPAPEPPALWPDFSFTRFISPKITTPLQPTEPLVPLYCLMELNEDSPTLANTCDSVKWAPFTDECTEKGVIIETTSVSPLALQMPACASRTQTRLAATKDYVDKHYLEPTSPQKPPVGCLLEPRQQTVDLEIARPTALSVLAVPETVLVTPEHWELLDMF